MIRAWEIAALTLLLRLIDPLRKTPCILRRYVILSLESIYRQCFREHPLSGLEIGINLQMYTLFFLPVSLRAHKLTENGFKKNFYILSHFANFSLSLTSDFKNILLLNRKRLVCKLHNHIMQFYRI